MVVDAFLFPGNRAFMATQFLTLPTLAANGAGAAIDVSTFAATKTLVNAGNGYIYEPFVTLEISCDAGAVHWTPIYTFEGALRDVTLDIVCHWMRAVVSNYRGGGAPKADVGAETDAAAFGTLVATAGSGAGAAVATNALPIFKTVQVTSAFKGTVSIQISEDGVVDWSPQMSFSAPGQQTMEFTAAFMRAVRVGVPGVDPGLPLIDIAADHGPGGGGSGGAGIDLQDEGVAIAGNPHNTLNFIGPAITVVDAGGGVANITVAVTAGVDIRDEGVALAGNPHSTLNFVGAGVLATDAGAGVANITIPGGITVADEGAPIAGNPHSTLNFVGAGVTATDAGAGVSTVTIPGGIAGLAAQNQTVAVAGSPFPTLNFNNVGIVATNEGAGVLGIASNPPYVDLRFPPYNIVANSSTLAVRQQNTAGIKAAIAAFNGTYARLVLPDGAVYVEQDGINGWCIMFGNGVNNLTLAGQGMYATTLVQFCVGFGGELDLIRIDGIGGTAQRIELCDFGMYQDTITTPDPAQQNHLLCLYNITPGGITQNINCHDLWFGKSIGDGIRILSQATPDVVNHVRFNNIVMQCNGVVTSTPPNGRNGARSGIAMQRGGQDIWFTGVTIDGVQNQALDFEPTGGAGVSACSDIWFNWCRFDNSNAVSNTGIPVTIGGQALVFSTNIRMTNCEIIQGQLGVIYTQDVTFSNVTVRSNSPMPANEVTLLVRQTNDRLVFDNCKFQRLGTTAVSNVVNVENLGESTTFNNCMMQQGTGTYPFICDITNNLRIKNCTIYYSSATNPAGLDAIAIQAVNGNANNIQIDGLQVVSTAVMLDAVAKYTRGGRTTTNTSVINVNAQGSVTRGFTSNDTVGTNFDKNPVLTGWEIGVSPLWRSEDNGNNQTFTLFPIVAGNRALESTRTLNGIIAPIGNCTGQLGDHYVWRPTTTTSNRWRKATETVAGTPDNTGWDLVEGSTLTPAALGAGTTNNYAPAGIDATDWLRQDISAAGAIVTGLLVATASLGNQRPVVINNLATNTLFTLTLTNEDAGSTAANRFILPGGASLVIPSGGSVVLKYDLTSARWRVA